MELDRTKSWPYYLLGLSIVFILFLGGWWLYLVFTLALKLKEMNSPILQGNLVTMVQWEGLAFLSITLMVGIAVFIIFLSDARKSRATQSFYASLTHELKTPLASMKLQSQVLSDLIAGIEEKESPHYQKILKYSKRLQEDSIRLEDEIDRHLQLSRVELSSKLTSAPINILSLIKSLAVSYPTLAINFITESSETEVEIEAIADQSAVSMIFKNLFENTLRHRSIDGPVSLSFKEGRKYIHINYDDHGGPFGGDSKKLSSLFYKYKSPKGSGIGLFLIKKLMKKQKGKFVIKANPHLSFKLSFLKGVDIRESAS